MTSHIEIIYIFFGINIIPEQILSRPTLFDVIQPHNITLIIGCLIVVSIHWQPYLSYWYFLTQ